MSGRPSQKCPAVIGEDFSVLGCRQIKTVQADYFGIVEVLPIFDCTRLCKCYDSDADALSLSLGKYKDSSDVYYFVEQRPVARSRRRKPAASPKRIKAKKTVSTGHVRNRVPQHETANPVF